MKYTEYWEREPLTAYIEALLTGDLVKDEVTRCRLALALERLRGLPLAFEQLDPKRRQYLLLLSLVGFEDLDEPAFGLH